MELNDYGPFANIVAIIFALVATFSVSLVKMLGKVRRWTWLVADAPPFLVTGGARVLAVAVMAVAYITIDESNYQSYRAAPVLTGFVCLLSVVYFDRLRRRYVVQVPIVNKNGGALSGARARPRHINVVIGPEDQLFPDAARSLKSARARYGGVSLRKFMSGYGSPVNDPQALWPMEILARIGNRLTLALLVVILFAVMTAFLSALVIVASTQCPEG